MNQPISAESPERWSMTLAVLITLLAGVLVAVPSPHARAATLVVDQDHPSCDDVTGVPAYCTIDAAIGAAQSGDTIQIAAGTYTGGAVYVFDHVPQNSGDVKDLTIVGAGAGQTIIDGQGSRGAMRVGIGPDLGPVSYVVRDLTITGGSLISAAGLFVGASSGSSAQLSLIDVEIVGNSATGLSGGGLYIASLVTAELEGVTIVSNTADGSGGGVYIAPDSAVTITDSEIWGNESLSGPGGGIAVQGSTLTIDDTQIHTNVAGTSGGGVYASSPGTVVEIIASEVFDNDSFEFGGGLDFNVPSDTGGVLSVIDSVFSGNRALFDGWGGGARVLFGSHVISGSLFVGNEAGGSGGGIYYSATTGDPNSLVITNTTFSGNIAEGSGGALISAHANSNLVVASSTFTGNHADTSSGAIHGLNGAVVRNSIIFGNTTGGANPECSGVVSAGYNLIGSAEGTCFTAIDPTTLYATDPGLAALADNDGPTETHAIDVTSPAVNAGNPAVPGSGGDACEEKDQRGLPRGPDRCDIGAFELQVAGSVSGTVTAFDGTGPIEAAMVTLYTDGGAYVSEGMTDALGEYSVPTAGDGTYKVRFTAPHYVGQWWDGQPTFAAATSIAAANSQAVTAIDAALVEVPPLLIRLAGPNRFATAAAVSEHHHPSGAETAYVATGSNFPDALAGATAAAANDAPLLLVSSVPEATVDELDRLDPADLVLLGGTAAISDATAAELAAWGSIERLAGANRYLTAIEISKHMFGDGEADIVVVATGTGFADALAGAAAAAALGGPVLLTPPNTLPQSVADEIARLDPDGIVVLGGPSAISAAVFDALDAIRPATRVAGANRYETAVAVSGHAFPDPGDVSRVYIAVGTNFPDALAGAAAAAANGAPILLTPTASLPQAVADEITRLDPTIVFILGGTSVVSENVESQLAALLGL